MNLYYSTDSVECNQRLGYWTDVICKHCIPASSRFETVKNFSASLNVRRFDDLEVTTISSSPHDWERTANYLRKTSEDDYWLGFIEKGYTFFEQDGREVHLREGDMTLYDASKPFRNHIDASAMHVVRLPRAEIEKKIPGIDNFIAMMLDKNAPFMSPMREMLLEMTRRGASEELFLSGNAYAGECSRLLLELISSCINLQSAGYGNKDYKSYARIINYIQRNIGDSELTLKKIAGDNHISTRTLTRIFARYGQSPMSIVWQKRLDLCKKILSDGHAKNITQVALEYGFKDMSHFSQAFKKQFGMTPKEVYSRNKFYFV
ncbi:helix-turn-helix domain-containing protein [Klebsiella pneumoniae]|uniref:helix-turn-helix domain-containing protein n=1 Tax=Klebsiella pneumoniae TaxID=573 RepID=UPI000DE62966|nr:helix-turn-helix domain-containing protein [Klebsiella pneumoniae]SSF82691.1 AraC family transcriptional regulator [Klebsiella pneumoniae]HDZ1695243.1 helix-turn-helix domain-containing protein [Klebsiella pneumoniae]